MRSRATLNLAIVLSSIQAAVPAASQPISANVQRTSVARIMTRLRAAVGFRNLASLSPGVSITDAQGSGPALVTLFGTRAGEYRLGGESGFDGRYRWQMDSRRGRAIPNSVRQHEKAAWPLWVRTHWWLNPASHIEVALSEAQSTVNDYALSLRDRNGVVPATLYIARTTMLPDRLVVSYDRGPFEAVYSDWRPFHGVLVARDVKTSYRNATHVRTLSIARLTAPRFSPPAAATDATFDASAPARLAVKRGPDFASGERGHSFVEARVNGKSAGWWLVDSGADGMLIDETLADELHMPVLGESRSIGADGKPRRATWRRGVTFSVGKLTYPNPLFLAVDLADSTAPRGEKRSGVIGYDLFARAVVEYGRGGDDILICDPMRYRPARPPRWQPLDFIDQTPAIATRFEGNREGIFQIDTGAAGSVDLYRGFIDRTHLLDRRETREVQSVGAGGIFSMRAGKIAWIDLGGKRFRDVEAGFRTAAGRDGAGVIGRALFGSFRTIFDYPHRRIAFVPESSAETGRGRCD